MWPDESVTWSPTTSGRTGACAVAKVMVGFGSRLQYSVFVCDLTYAELCDMRLSLGEVVHHRVDSVVIVPLGEGYDMSAFEFIGPAPSLPKGGSTIV